MLLTLALHKRGSRATICRLVSLLLAPRGVAIEVDCHDHERAVPIGATLAQAPLHPHPALVEWLVLVETVDPPRPPVAGDVIIGFGQPRDRRSPAAYRNPRLLCRRTNLRQPLLLARRGARAKRLRLALELAQLATEPPQAHPPFIGDLIDYALGIVAVKVLYVGHSGREWDPGYARVSTDAQGLTAQRDPLPSVV